MNIKALIDFTDRETGETRARGEEYEYEKTRAEKLIRKGFASKAAEKKKPAAAKEEKPTTKAKKK